MTELYPSDSDLNLLSGTSDGEQEVLYVATGESPYYTSFYKMLHRLLDVARRAGDLRVFKDGDLTFGIRGGKFLNADYEVSYAGASVQALTNNQTNYIYLTISGATPTVVTNITGFPTASDTPHIPLATILTAAGTYAHTDITDYRGRAFLRVCGDTLLAEAQAFFDATDISGAEAETLSGGSNADALHNHAAAGLDPTIQDLIPYITITGTDDGDGTGAATIQAKDAGGNDLAQRFLIRTWIADAEYNEPDPQTDFSVTAGEQMRELETDADYEVISDATGLAGMNIDAGGAKTVYVMAEINGRIYSSGAIAITTP